MSVEGSTYTCLPGQRQRYRCSHRHGSGRVRGVSIEEQDIFVTKQVLPIFGCEPYQCTLIPVAMACRRNVKVHL
jgi:hypothetical protein